MFTPLKHLFSKRICFQKIFVFQIPNSIFCLFRKGVFNQLVHTNECMITTGFLEHYKVAMLVIFEKGY
ncbi:hypothetical protein BCS92_03790 [Vibrio tasmaniensis]|uniref:Uncharacterized protein n=1 Tax=Vibrio tasmaniensis TaxID=212663 RepID=A0A2N7NBZ3_9VIBR|nr:hypothetical protein BCS92_03790 [Vibrio tasmaniensis]